MRLHQLDLSAFGPFAGAVNLNLEDANDAGLFLLRGDTGAGKTTLLDAISYALFGDVPGVRQSGTNLRSDHALADVPTSVTLELTLAGERLRINRRPQQHRPAKRGDGFVDDPATVTLHRFAHGDWQPLASKSKEVATLLAPRIGMSAEQFHQVVLLPQGSFAKFLHSSAEERRPLLESLFATQRFEAIEKWLKKEADQRSATVGDAKDALWRAVATTAAHAGIDDPQPDAMEPAEVPEWARGLADEAEATAQVAESASATASTVLVAARRAHLDASKLVETQQRHADAVRRQRELDEQLPAVEARRLELAAARRAAVVVPFDEAVRQRRTELDAAEGRLHAAISTASALGLPVDDIEELTDERDRAVAALGEVERVETEVAGQRGLVERQANHLTALAAISAARAAIAERAATRPAQLAIAEAAARAASDAEAKLDGHRLRLQHATDVVDAVRRRDELSTALQSAAMVVANASEHAQSTRSAAVEVRAMRLAGMAAELARGLEPEGSCPVCGSTEHPSPAEPSDGAVSADHQTQLDNAADIAQAELREAESAATAIKSELAQCTAVAGEVRVDDADSIRRSESEALSVLRSLATEVEAHRATVEGLRAAETVDTEQLEQLGRSESTEREELATVETKLAAIDERLAAALEGFDDLAQRRSALDAVRAAADALLDARRADLAATAESTTASASLEAAVADAGFATIDAARVAIRTRTAIDTLEAEVRVFDDAVAAATAALGDPALIEAAESEVPDIASLTSALSEAEHADKEAATVASAVRTRATGLAADAEALSAQLDTLAPLLDAAHQAHSLHRLANGTGTDNQKRMRLSTYVLAAKLEQVAEVASARLQRMSGGRYTLEFTDEEDGRGRGGLGLQVTDAWSMKSRSTSTLSGGESFFASLALALALADVVSAESAGAPLETLFIDEGFGSLDAETLDDVMEVLDGLREGGRTIGVVSHVADLRQRIGVQLVVEKTTTGSTVSWTSGG